MLADGTKGWFFATPQLISNTTLSLSYRRRSRGPLGVASHIFHKSRLKLELSPHNFEAQLQI